MAQESSSVIVGHIEDRWYKTVPGAEGEVLDLGTFGEQRNKGRRELARKLCNLSFVSDVVHEV